MGLESMLKQEIELNPEQYSQETVDRVSKIAKFVDKKPGRYVPYRLLKDISDFQLYYQIHPEWYGKNTSQMAKDPKINGARFLAAFRTWAVKESKGDREFQKQLIQQIFPRTHIDWTYFTKIEEWIEYRDMYKEWKGLSIKEIRADKENGGNKFYQSARLWIRKEAKGDKHYDKALMRKLFTYY